MSTPTTPALDIAEVHRLIIELQHASINFYQDEHPDDLVLIAPHRARKCPDCGLLLMAAVKDGLMCPRCGWRLTTK
jgi:ribosomal protein S27AE